MELYDLEAFYNVKPKQNIYEKRSKVVNYKDEHGEIGIEGFWLQVKRSKIVYSLILIRNDG